MPRPTQTSKARATNSSLVIPKRPEQLILKLYVAGMTQNSLRAIEDARRFCETHLGDRYALEVIDIYQRPALARDEQIVAVPTLVRKLPLPLRKLVGDLSDTERILIGLDLRSR